MSNKINLKAQAKDQFTEYLNRSKHRKTPERYAILNRIYSMKGHFNVDTLFNEMKSKEFTVSRATLYNTMELLLDAGLVIKHQFGNNIAQYEKTYGNENHAHIICLSCGKIKEYKKLDILTFTEQKKIKQFKTSYYNMYIYGVCSKCEEQTKNKNKNK